MQLNILHQQLTSVKVYNKLSGALKIGHTAKSIISSSIQIHKIYSITVLNCEASQVETCIHHAWEACVWDRDGNKHLSIWPVKLFSPLAWHTFFRMKDKKKY